MEVVWELGGFVSACQVDLLFGVIVEEGAAGQVVERFASSEGYVQGFPGFVSM